MVRLDILGRFVEVQVTTASRLRDRAAAEAGRSAPARDLALVLDRAVQTGAVVSLHRSETRALLVLLEAEQSNELVPLIEVVRAALAGR